MKLTNTDSDTILAEKIRFFSQIVHQFCEEKYFRQASDFPLSSNQYYILLVLESSGPLTPGTLAELLDISAAAVVKNVDKLVKYNLVSRNPNHNDRRSLEIELLPDGLAIVKNYIRIKQQNTREILQHFSSEEKEVMGNLLRKYLYYCLEPQTQIPLICLLCNISCDDECILGLEQNHCQKYINKPDNNTRVKSSSVNETVSGSGGTPSRVNRGAD